MNGGLDMTSGYRQGQSRSTLKPMQRFDSVPNRPTSGNNALQGLAGSRLAGRFRSWHGRSGQRYVFSVYPDAVDGDSASPRYEKAVIIAAQPLRDGTSRLVAIAETGYCPDLFFDGAMMAQARSCGATEIHVHLLAGSASERAAIVTDLMPF